MIKKYVKVNIDVDELGNITPRYIVYDDRQYQIDKVIARKLCASTKVGGVGMRYTIRISGQQTYIWEEQGRWWVEAKK